MTYVWRTKLDNRYDIVVERVDDQTGYLVIREGENELLRDTVSLAYGAVFGPDVDDVMTWQNRAIEFVDTLKT